MSDVPQRLVPKGFQAWPEQGEFGALSEAAMTEMVIELYNNQFAGVLFNPEDKEAFRQETKRQCGHEYLDDIATASGWADSGEGKLCIPFIYVLEAYPGCWPGPAQQCGDCVSHSDKNAKLGTMVIDAKLGRKDEVTGQVEGIPKVSAEGIKNGVISTEAAYWYRGYSGDGWQCELAAEVSKKQAGLVLRGPNECGVDFTVYSQALAHKYGARKPEENVTKILSRNLVRSTAQAKSREAVRDAIANANFLSTCGGEGFENVRDANGVSRRKGSWAHAMAAVGFDDRPIIVKLYGEPLVLILNSWAKWNTGPRDIVESAKLVPSNVRQKWIDAGIVNPETGNLMIPHGSFWAKWSDVKSRWFGAYSSVNGFPAQKLPDWGVSLAG